MLFFFSRKAKKCPGQDLEIAIRDGDLKTYEQVCDENNFFKQNK